MTLTTTVYIEAVENTECDTNGSVEFFELRLDREAMTRLRDAHKVAQILKAEKIDLAGLAVAITETGVINVTIAIGMDGSITTQAFTRVKNLWPICSTPTTEITLAQVESWLRDYPTGTAIFVGQEQTVALPYDKTRNNRDIANDIFFGETSGIDDDLIVALR